MTPTPPAGFVPLRRRNRGGPHTQLATVTLHVANEGDVTANTCAYRRRTACRIQNLPSSSRCGPGSSDFGCGVRRTTLSCAVRPQSVRPRQPWRL